MESFQTECRGRGLRTLDFIQAGAFVIEYLGELIGLKHAELLIEQREKNNEPNYIMFLRKSPRFLTFWSNFVENLILILMGLF